MRALVIFESMFGNTEKVARAVAAGLSTQLQAETRNVLDAPVSSMVDEPTLLVVGGPTHAFGMSRPGTRRDARQRGARAASSEGIGVREWLATLPRNGNGAAAAAFDTRVRKPRVPGSAAHAAEKRLRHLGYWVVEPAESFWVEDVAGPVSAGEVDRARRWGEHLAAVLDAASRQPIG